MTTLQVYAAYGMVALSFLYVGLMVWRLIRKGISSIKPLQMGNARWRNPIDDLADLFPFKNPRVWATVYLCLFFALFFFLVFSGRH